MKRGPLPPRTQAPRRTPVKKRNAKRHTREWARAYGSPERVAAINAKPCCWCGLEGYTENAHTESGGGSRKANASTIAPLCGAAYQYTSPIAYTLTDGCHEKYDRHERPFDVEGRRDFVKSCAADTEAEFPSRPPQTRGREENG